MIVHPVWDGELLNWFHRHCAVQIYAGGELCQPLAVFDLDENSHVFRILPQTGSFALPRCHNTATGPPPTPP